MKIEHLNNVIYQKIANFMDILILGLVNPNLVRHISKKFQKTEKKIVSIELGHLKHSNCMSMII